MTGICNITQPALSKRIKTLEDGFGYSLFFRETEGLRLTRTGEMLLSDAKKSVIQFEKTHRLSKEMAQGERGVLDIGFGLSSIRVAPELVASFRHKHPKIKIMLEDMSSTAQIKRLFSGQLQIGFMGLPVSDEFNSLPLYEERLAVAANACQQKKLFEQGCLDSAGVESVPYLRLMPLRGPSLNSQIKKYLEHHELRPKISQETKNVQTLLALVASGAGYAIVPQSAGNITCDRVILTPLEGGFSSWQVGLVWKKNEDDPKVSLFIDNAKKTSFH